ncbi:MAG: LysE family translocator [Cellvibrio sp.]|uniref:LysE family translocator n=1 Tax=Cellvibrio sp. TaxID=1965322 RepID=UPI0031A0E657
MDYLALILFVIATSITPGPNNILILASGVNYGIKKSLPHFFGINVGFPLVIIAAGLGAGILFKQFPVLHTLLKVVGICYLLYLAYRVATASTDKLNTEKKKPFTFIQAALFQWVNPKAWIMAIGAVVTFASAGGNYLVQVGTITLAFIFFGLPCTGLWLLFGASLKNLLSNPVRIRIFNWVMALLLVASLVPTMHELYVQFVV